MAESHSLAAGAEMTALVRCVAGPTIASFRVRRALAAAEEFMTVPTLYDWMGGMPAIDRLMTLFYSRVPEDRLLAPLFARMAPEHVAHVGAFVAEVLGGPQAYSQKLGGHPAMIRKHQGRALTEPQRQRWMQLLLECADRCGVPDDPEFRSAFVAYLEWGTRLAVLNSQPGAEATVDAPMPRWDWGVVKGPWLK